MSISIPLNGPLTEALFVERPNRFLVRGELADGTIAEAHLADPGRLRELLLPGRRLWLRPVDNPNRKTRWTAVLVQTPEGQGLVSVDTLVPNRLVGEALRRGALSEFREWRLDRAEKTVGRSRFDFAMERKEQVEGLHGRLLLEVKSVSLVEAGIGLFPDAVTARGARHVQELAELTRSGEWSTAVLFVVQRDDAEEVQAAESIDPAFAAALAEAKEAGVRILARRCRVEVDRVVLGNPVAVGIRRASR